MSKLLVKMLQNTNACTQQQQNIHFCSSSLQKHVKADGKLETKSTFSSEQQLLFPRSWCYITIHKSVLTHTT